MKSKSDKHLGQGRPLVPFFIGNEVNTDLVIPQINQEQKRALDSKRRNAVGPSRKKASEGQTLKNTKTNWANPAFFNSPAPENIPIPSFLNDSSRTPTNSAPSIESKYKQNQSPLPFSSSSSTISSVSPLSPSSRTTEGKAAILKLLSPESLSQVSSSPLSNNQLQPVTIPLSSGNSSCLHLLKPSNNPTAVDHTHVQSRQNRAMSANDSISRHSAPTSCITQQHGSRSRIQLTTSRLPVNYSSGRHTSNGDGQNTNPTPSHEEIARNLKEILKIGDKR